jgi:hypothetical protein
MPNDRDPYEKYKISNKKKNISNKKIQISKAPAPFKTVSGSGPSFTVKKWRSITEKPNWKEWKYTPQVQVWEACALSLDIEPNSIKRDPNSWLTGQDIYQLFKDESFQSENEKKEFEGRQRILLSNLNSKENSLCFSPNDNCPNLGEVSLPEFAAWCPSVEWSIPEELAALAEKSEADTLADNKNTKIKVNFPEGEPKEIIIARFEGLHFNKNQWKNNLADPPKWLKSCRVMLGNHKASALWNPVDIAVELYSKNIVVRQLDAVFEGWKIWEDKWSEKRDYLEK